MIDIFQIVWTIILICGFTITGWNGSPVNFYSYMTFVCQRKQKFIDNFSRMNVQAQCTPNNTWIPPPDWGTCAESKSQNEAVLSDVISGPYFLL